MTSILRSDAKTIVDIAGPRERVDDPLFPLEALRDALASALCHRDYSSGAGSADSAACDDHLEIVSGGGLHPCLTPADLFAAILLLEPALDANYERVKVATSARGAEARHSQASVREVRGEWSLCRLEWGA